MIERKFYENVIEKCLTFDFVTNFRKYVNRFIAFSEQWSESESDKINGFVHVFT